MDPFGHEAGSTHPDSVWDMKVAKQARNLHQSKPSKLSSWSRADTIASPLESILFMLYLWYKFFMTFSLEG